MEESLVEVGWESFHSHLCYGFARVGPFEMRGDDRRIWGIGIVSDHVCSCL